MEGKGYFWKGLADSFSGYRDKKFEDDKAMQDRKFKREQAGWDFLSGKLDREQRATDSLGQRNLSGQQIGLSAAASVTGTFSAAAKALREQAADILDPTMNANPTPEQRSEARRLQAKARALDAKALNMGTGIGTRLNIPDAQAKPGILAQLDALIKNDSSRKSAGGGFELK